MDGDSLQTKRVSSVAKIVILDRGGGCVNALALLERDWVIAGDTCKTHGADLLLEDVGKPFKTHIKESHELIIFIINHDVVCGIFASSGPRALLLPAGTRFATEVICLESLLRDKAEIQKLFVNADVVEWVDKQPTEIKQKFRKHKANALSDEWWHRTEV